MRTLSAHISAIVHATEEVARVMEAMNNLCPKDKFEVTPERTRFKGHHGNEIITLNLSVGSHIAKSFLPYVLGLFHPSDRRKVLSELQTRIDETGRLHMRVDKQESLRRKFQFSDQDPIKIEILFQIDKSLDLSLVEQVRRHVTSIADSIEG